MSSLRDILKRVPQDPEFHPEGNVWVHTRAVRNSLDEALRIIRTSGICQRLAVSEIEPTRRECRLLRLAAWCHDLGKADATRLHDGRWISPGHERPRRLNPVLRRLGWPWKAMWDGNSFDDRKAFVYVMIRHMSICDTCGIDPRIARALASGDRARRGRAVLLIVMLIMDRLGCARSSRIEDALLAIAAIEKTIAMRPQGPCGNPNCRVRNLRRQSRAIEDKP